MHRVLLRKIIDLVKHLHLTSISQGIKFLAEIEKSKFCTSNEKEVVVVVVVVQETQFFETTGCRYHGKMPLTLSFNKENVQISDKEQTEAILT